MLNSCTSSTQTSNHYEILDSGATDHYLHRNPNKEYISQSGYNPITVTLPNGTT